MMREEKLWSVCPGLCTGWAGATQYEYSTYRRGVSRVSTCHMARRFWDHTDGRAMSAKAESERHDLTLGDVSKRITRAVFHAVHRVAMHGIDLDRHRAFGVSMCVTRDVRLLPYP